MATEGQAIDLKSPSETEAVLGPTPACLIQKYMWWVTGSPHFKEQLLEIMVNGRSASSQTYACDLVTSPVI